MKRGAPDHWKMKALAMRLKVPSRYAIAWANGTMERLWHYTAKYHPQGDIGKAPDWAIAEACGWPAVDAVDLIEALIDVRFLVRSTAHRLIVHAWAEHADDAVKKTLKNRELEFFLPENSSTDAGKFRPAFPLPLPKPLPLPLIPASGDAVVFSLAAPEPENGRAKPISDERMDGFDEFWKLRWNSKDKMSAQRSFRKMAKTLEDRAKIMSAVSAQRSGYLQRELEKRPYMSTWLNQQRFLDPEESEELAAAPIEVVREHSRSKAERDAAAAEEAYQSAMRRHQNGSH